jgi:hypothetical protein
VLNRGATHLSLLVFRAFPRRQRACPPRARRVDLALRSGTNPGSPRRERPLRPHGPRPRGGSGRTSPRLDRRVRPADQRSANPRSFRSTPRGVAAARPPHRPRTPLRKPTPPPLHGAIAVVKPPAKARSATYAGNVEAREEAFWCAGRSRRSANPRLPLPYRSQPPPSLSPGPGQAS